MSLSALELKYCGFKSLFSPLLRFLSIVFHETQEKNKYFFSL